MRTNHCVLLLLLSVSCSAAHGGSHRSSGSGSRPVHVDGYYRHNGTYVPPHDRSLPENGHHPAHAAPTPPAYHPPRHCHAATPRQHRYSTGYMAEGYTSHPTVQRDAHGRIKRSESARNAFKQDHPCPSTGRNSGSCPGYVIDHVNPLECGGADAPFNMQWQTIAAGKAKDKTERYCR
jgi:5-methylcytosine-specific restriction endonuclease McrA